MEGQNIVTCQVACGIPGPGYVGRLKRDEKREYMCTAGEGRDCEMRERKSKLHKGQTRRSTNREDQPSIHFTVPFQVKGSWCLSPGEISETEVFF